MLDVVLGEFGVGDQLSEEPAPFQVMDSIMSETSLASRCVIKQAWPCLAELVKQCGVEYIKTQTDTRLNPQKYAEEYAEECDLL